MSPFPDSERDGAEAVAALILGLLWTPFAAVLFTLTLGAFWRWFFIPLGLPDLRLPHLYGIALAVSLATKSTPKPDDRPPLHAFVADVATTVVRLGLALAGGWVALQLLGGAA